MYEIFRLGKHRKTKPVPKKISLLLQSTSNSLKIKIQDVQENLTQKAVEETVKQKAITSVNKNERAPHCDNEKATFNGKKLATATLQVKC